MSTCGIYKIENKINHKVYIGLSSNIEERWRAHRTRPFQKNAVQYDSLLYKAIRKYGLSNFEFSIVELCSQKELSDKEIFWISYYDSYNNGYNETEGGYNASTSSILSNTEITEIQDLLKNSSMSQEEIGKKYNVSQRTISAINLGQYHLTENIIYPIREKNKKQQYFCIECNKNIVYQKGNMCVECANLKMRKVKNRPDKESLKKLIRENSFLSIGRMYNVSDATIRKWCKVYNLPYKKTEINKYTEEDWKKI